MTPQPPPLPQVDREELPPELSNELWDSSLVLTDTRKDAEAWYHKVKGLIYQHLQVAVEEALQVERKWYDDRLVDATNNGEELFDISEEFAERLAQLQPNTPNNDEENS